MADKLDQICARFRGYGFEVERLENSALIKAKAFVITVVCNGQRCIATHIRRLQP